MDVQTVPVVEELAVEASEDEHEPADEGAGVAATGLGGAASVDEGPSLGVWAEVVEVVLVFCVSSSEDEHLVLVDRG